MPKPPKSSVLLGIHADNHLNVYVRTGDELHQAARIVTTNGTDAATMTTVMADLAEAFDWHKIVADPPLEVPERGLPRAGVAAVVAAPASRPPSRGSRRKNEDMERQRQTVLTIVDAIPESEAIAVPAIAAQVKRMLHFKGKAPATSVRSQLTDLYAEGRVGRVSYKHPNGSDGARWYGLPPVDPVDSRLSVEV